MPVHSSHLPRLAMGTARLLGLLLLPCLAMQGCATAPPAATKPPPSAAARAELFAAARAELFAAARAAPFAEMKPQSSADPKVATEVFPKGMRLVVQEVRRGRQVRMYMSYRVGATDEPAGKQGLAQLAARLTRMARHGGASAQTLEARLEAAAVMQDTVVTHDDTELSGILMFPERLASVVELEAQRMSEPLAHVTEEDFRRVRARLMDDLWVRYEGSAKGRGPAQRWLHEKLLAGHPYGRPAGGTPESLEQITLEDVRAFVKANYTPARAVLVVSGPVSSAEVKFEVIKSFGGLAGMGTEERLPPVERVPPPAPEDSLERAPMQVVRGSVKVPRLHFLLTLPGRYSGKYAEGKLAQEVLRSWMDANLKRDEYPLGKSFTVQYQELDGLTLLDCSVDLMRQVREEEARKLAPSMLTALGGYADRVLEEMKEAEATSSTSAQPENEPPGSAGPDSYGRMRMRLEQELRREAFMNPAMDVARVFRATGRADITRLREEQMKRALTHDVMSPYLRQYFRGERVRTMLILP